MCTQLQQGWHVQQKAITSQVKLITVIQQGPNELRLRSPTALLRRGLW
jgi:hypothetical protein